MNRKFAALGIIGISVMLAAEPVCRRIILPAIHKHHTAATVARWKEWNKTHPAPKPVVHELDILCPEMQEQDASVTTSLPPVDTPVWDDQQVLIPQLDIPEAATPTYEAPDTGVPLTYAGFTTSPSRSTLPPVVTPEPSTICLLLTGIASLVAGRRLRGC